uniref:Uncharacterized protein n=1 Tax=Encephalitozoon cuniculi TaxID=6035 RepID=M1K684_ENCCN|nr:hypothetical protein ECU06_0090 [Encephalitozoon cuniculi]
MWLICMAALFDMLYCSEVEESMERIFEMLHGACGLETEEMRGVLKRMSDFRTYVLFPLILHDDKLVVSPDMGYKDIEKEERIYVEKIIKKLPSLVWQSMVFLYIPEHDNWILGLMNTVFDTSSSRFSDSVGIYKKSRGRSEMRLVDLMMGMFRNNVSMMEKFGRGLAHKAEVKMKEIPNEISKEEREKRKEVLDKIREYGKSLGTREKQEQILKAQEIVFDTCIYLWRREEDRISFVLKVYLRSLQCKMLGLNKGALADDVNQEVSLLHSISHEILINTHNKYGIEVTAELIKRLFLEYMNIDEEYVSNVVEDVKKKKEEERREEEEEKKRKEEVVQRNVEELLRGEEEEKKGAKAKRKSKKKKKGSKKPEEKESEVEEVSENREAQEMEDSREACSKERNKEQKNESGRCYYKLHKRVLLWREEPEKIKKKWDSGTEERWKGKSIGEIREQKELHDISEISQLLKSQDANNFFICTGEYMKNGIKRWKMVAIAVLETRDWKKLGVVEVGLFKDKDEQNVIFHLMFRPTDLGRAGAVVRSALAKVDNMEKVDDTDDSLDISGFTYPKNTRSEVVRGLNEFRVVWRNPKNTAEVIRSLTVMSRPGGN